MSKQDNPKFNLADYHVSVPLFHQTASPVPLSEQETLNLECLREQALAVEDWVNKVSQNESMEDQYKHRRKEMAIKFHEDVMDYVFGESISYEGKEAIFSYICTTLGVEDSLESRENIFHALLGFRDLVAEVCTSPSWFKKFATTC
jgi:hypothetical protein